MSFNEWKEYRLDEVYDFASGLSKKASEFGSGFPFLSFKDVFYNYFIPDELESLVNTTDKEQQKCSIKRGDVFLTRTSETLNELGMSCVALKDYEYATFNGFTKRLRPKNNVYIYPEYAGYYFRSSKFRNAVTSMSIMTTRASLNNDMLGVLKIIVPPLSEQKAIANVLLSLDKKIELNNQMNKTLEEMAQALFKRWFVDFEFPNEEEEPYKSSGGEMVESELGMIPKGWEVTELGSILEVGSGKRPSKKSSTLDKEFTVPLIGASSTMGYVQEALYNEPILVIGRVGTHGVVQRFDYKVWPSDNTLVIKTRYYNYVYQVLKMIDYSAINRGSTQPLITQSDIKATNIIKPNTAVVKKYEEVTSSLFKYIDQNNEQSYMITGIRDAVLPKLMSGEIRVTDL